MSLKYFRRAKTLSPGFRAVEKKLAGARQGDVSTSYRRMISHAAVDVMNDMREITISVRRYFSAADSPDKQSRPKFGFGLR